MPVNSLGFEDAVQGRVSKVASLLKKQILIGESLKTYEETEQIVFEYIESYYNLVRRHSNNN